jgi:hypothetical protein
MTIQEYLETNIKITEEALKEKRYENIRTYLRAKLETLKTMQKDIDTIINL